MNRAFLVIQLISAVVYSGCQRLSASKPADSSKWLLPASRAKTTVLVRGKMIGHDTTAAPTLGAQAIFSRKLPDNTLERIGDRAMPTTGSYQVRLAANQTYVVYIVCKKGDVHLWAEEVAISDKYKDSCWTKNFYLPYYDTTGVGSCLKARKPLRTNY